MRFAAQRISTADWKISTKLSTTISTGFPGPFCRPAALASLSHSHPARAVGRSLGSLAPALWPATGIGYTCEEHGRPTERRVTNCSWHERHEASSRRGGLQRLAARFRNPSFRPRLKFASILESKRIGQAGDWWPVSIGLVCVGRDIIGVQAERLEPSRYGGQMDLRCPAHSGTMAIRSRSTALRDPIMGVAGVSLYGGPSPAPE
jgi:hypothetical protein